MTGRTAQNAVAAAQIIGDRDNQEDSLATHELEADVGEHGGVLLLVPADGMGGRAGGNVASRLVVERFSESYISCHTNISDALISSLNSANEQLAHAVAETPRLRGMATMLIGCVISENRMYWV